MKENDSLVKAYKKYYLLRIGMTALFGAFLGGMLLLARSYAVEIFDILLIAVGLMTAVMNLPSCLYSLFHIKHRGEWINFLVSLAAVVFGVLLMLIHRDTILLLLGIFSVVFPIIRVILVEEHKKRFKRELPMIFFGIFMVFVSLTDVEELVFLIGGIVSLAMTALYLIVSLITLRIRLSILAEWEEKNSEQGEQ